MGFADFLHVRMSMFRGRADVPGYIRRNEYKKILSDTQQAVSPEKGDFMPLHTEWKQDYRPPHSATVFFSSLLPRPSPSLLVCVGSVVAALSATEAAA